MLRSQYVEIRPAARADQAGIQVLVRGLTPRTVADRWQGAGIGTQLVSDLLALARTAGFLRLEGDVLSGNRPMLQLLQRAGFRLRRDRESALFLHASLALPQRSPNFTCNTAAAL